jgi:hypothetical protein
MSSESRNPSEVADSDPICPIWLIAGVLPFMPPRMAISDIPGLSETPDLAGIAVGRGESTLRPLPKLTRHAAPAHAARGHTRH